MLVVHLTGIGRWRLTRWITRVNVRSGWTGMRGMMLMKHVATHLLGGGAGGALLLLLLLLLLSWLLSLSWAAAEWQSLSAVGSSFAHDCPAQWRQQLMFVAESGAMCVDDQSDHDRVTM